MNFNEKGQNLIRFLFTNAGDYDIIQNRGAIYVNDRYNFKETS